MYRIPFKPLSVNDVWQGKRWKTPEYTDYEEIMFTLLPRIKIPQGKLALSLKFGFGSTQSDLDNPVKPFVDILQKAYEFDDKRIYRLLVEKMIVPKGQEFIDFEFSSYE